MPPNFKKEIFDLRIRMEEEKAKEKDDRPNVKLGHGGLMDIEMIVQYLELRYGTKHPEVRQTNTLSALEKLTAKGLIDDDDAEILRSTYLFYKHLLSRIRLFSHHATDYLDPKSEHLSQIAETLGFQNKNVLVDEYRNKRKTIRKIYDKYLRPSQS